MNEINLSAFKGRKEALEKVIRYAPLSPMFYRTNLHIHTHRLSWMVEDALPLFSQAYPELEPLKLRILARVHDDPEIITGDIVYSKKRRMTTQEKAQLLNQEARAIETLAHRWPKEIQGYAYKTLLLSASRKDCLETVLLSYLDKIDAWCESLHELYAGNTRFHYPEDVEKPPVAGSTMKQFPKLFPVIKRVYLRGAHHPFFQPIPSINKETVLSTGAPHTIATISTPSGIPHYDHWKKLTLDYGKEQGVSWLTQQREF